MDSLYFYNNINDENIDRKVKDFKQTVNKYIAMFFNIPYMFRKN